MGPNGAQAGAAPSPSPAQRPDGARAEAVGAAGRTLRHAVSAPRTYPAAADICALLDELVAHGADCGEPLLSADAIINDRNGGGKSAMHLAAQLHPDAGVTRLFLRLGGDYDAATLRGHTPLIYAAGRGRWESAELLLAAGANAAVRCASGDTASLLAEKNPRLAPPGKAQEIRAIEAEHALLRGGWKDYTKDEQAMVHQEEHARTCPNCRPKLQLPEDVAAQTRATALADEIEALLLAKRATREGAIAAFPADVGVAPAAAALASVRLDDAPAATPAQEAASARIAEPAGGGSADGTLTRVVELLKGAADYELAAGGHGSKGGKSSVFGAPCSLRGCVLQLFRRFAGGDARTRIRADGTKGAGGQEKAAQERGHDDPAAPLLLLLRAARMDVLCPPGNVARPHTCSKAHARYAINAIARAIRAPREPSKRALEAAGIEGVVAHADTTMAADILRAWPSATAVQCTTPGAPEDVALVNLASRMLTPLALQARAQREELDRGANCSAAHAARTIPTAYTAPGGGGFLPSVSGLAQAIAWASAVRPRFWREMVTQAGVLATQKHKERALLVSLPKAVADDVRQVLTDAVAAGGAGAAPVAVLTTCPTPNTSKGKQASLEAAREREAHAAALAELPRAPPVPGAARHWVCDDANAERMVRALLERAEAADRQGKTLLLGVDCEWHEDIAAPERVGRLPYGNTDTDAHTGAGGGGGDAEVDGGESSGAFAGEVAGEAASERRQGAPALVQIALSAEVDGDGDGGGGCAAQAEGGHRDACWLVDVLHGSAACSRAVLQVLGHPAVIIVGFAFDSDVARLRLLAGGAGFSPCAPMIDVQACAQGAGVHAPGLGTPGLQRVCASLLGVFMSKEEQCSTWGERPLTESQLAYAALDAVMMLRLVRGPLAHALPPNTLKC